MLVTRKLHFRDVIRATLLLFVAESIHASEVESFCYDPVSAVCGDQNQHYQAWEKSRGKIAPEKVQAIVQEACASEVDPTPLQRVGDFKLLLDEGKCKYNKIEPAIVRAFEETLTYAKDIFENTIKPIIRDEVESAQWIQNSQWDFDQWAQRLEIGELANYSFLRSENKNHYSEEKELFHKICGIGLTFGAYTNRALTTLCLGTLIEMESSRQRGGFWGFGTLAHEHGHAIGAFSARELRSCLIDHHPNDTHDRKRTYENKQKKKEIASDLWASVFFSRWSVEHNVRFETLRGHLIRYCPQDKLDQTSYPPSHFRIRWIAQYPPLREALGCKTQPKIPMTCYPEK